jgi:hypothetical protein
MKKVIFLFCLLGGCANIPVYDFKVDTALESGKDKTISIGSPEKGIEITKLKPFFEDILKENGFKIVSGKQKARYGFVYGIQSKSWQSMQTIPVYGKTGISSIDTTSYGHMSGDSFGSYSGNYYKGGFDGIYSGGYNGSYSGSSHTDINYDYGVTGYHNAIVNNFRIDYVGLILDYKTNEVVYSSSLSGYSYVDKMDFAMYIMDIYTKLPFLFPTRNRFKCALGREEGICTN